MRSFPSLPACAASLRPIQTHSSCKHLACHSFSADIVKHHGAAISVAAKDWVDRYKAGRAAATAELLTFLLQACGGRDRCAVGSLWLLGVNVLLLDSASPTQGPNAAAAVRRKARLLRCRRCILPPGVPALLLLACLTFAGSVPCYPALLQSCGVDAVLTEEAVEEGEVDALRQELDSQAQEVLCLLCASGCLWCTRLPLLRAALARIGLLVPPSSGWRRLRAAMAVQGVHATFPLMHAACRCALRPKAAGLPCCVSPVIQPLLLLDANTAAGGARRPLGPPGGWRAGRQHRRRARLPRQLP